MIYLMNDGVWAQDAQATLDVNAIIEEWERDCIDCEEFRKSWHVASIDELRWMIKNPNSWQGGEENAAILAEARATVTATLAQA